MITQTIQSFAVTLSEAGYGNYVIVALMAAGPDAAIPTGLPHGLDAIIGGERTALEFPVDEDAARDAYRSIVKACRAAEGLLRSSVVLIEDGEVEETFSN